MMNRLSFTLKIKDLKATSIGKDSYNYFLRAEYAKGGFKDTPCKNLLTEEPIFIFEHANRLVSVEFWNEAKKKKVGTFKLKNFDSNKDFEHDFKKANITIHIKKVNQRANSKEYFETLPLTESFCLDDLSTDQETQCGMVLV